MGGRRVRSGRRRSLTWVAVIVAVLATPATTALASPPAVDQYTQHLPTAGGGGRAGSKPPIARLGLLPGKTRAALSGADGQVLAQITTARGLGAPVPVADSSGGSAGDSRDLATVLADTAGAPHSLALIGALVGIAAGAAWTRSSRRRRSSGHPG
jgi:hypothetical protein